MPVIFILAKKDKGSVASFPYRAFELSVGALNPQYFTAAGGGSAAIPGINHADLEVSLSHADVEAFLEDATPSGFLFELLSPVCSVTYVYAPALETGGISHQDFELITNPADAEIFLPPADPVGWDFELTQSPASVSYEAPDPYETGGLSHQDFELTTSAADAEIFLPPADPVGWDFELSTEFPNVVYASAPVHEPGGIQHQNFELIVSSPNAFPEFASILPDLIVSTEAFLSALSLKATPSSQSFELTLDKASVTGIAPKTVNITTEVGPSWDFAVTNSTTVPKDVFNITKTAAELTIPGGNLSAYSVTVENTQTAYPVVVTKDSLLIGAITSTKDYVNVTFDRTKDVTFDPLEIGLIAAIPAPTFHTDYTKTVSFENLVIGSVSALDDYTNNTFDRTETVIPDTLSIGTVVAIPNPTFHTDYDETVTFESLTIGSISTIDDYTNNTFARTKTVTMSELTIENVTTATNVVSPTNYPKVITKDSIVIGSVTTSTNVVIKYVDFGGGTENLNFLSTYTDMRDSEFNKLKLSSSPSTFTEISKTGYDGIEEVGMSQFSGSPVYRADNDSALEFPEAGENWGTVYVWLEDLTNSHLAYFGSATVNSGQILRFQPGDLIIQYLVP